MYRRQNVFKLTSCQFSVAQVFFEVKSMLVCDVLGVLKKKKNNVRRESEKKNLSVDKQSFVITPMGL